MSIFLADRKIIFTMSKKTDMDFFPKKKIIFIDEKNGNNGNGQEFPSYLWRVRRKNHFKNGNQTATKRQPNGNLFLKKTATEGVKKEPMSVFYQNANVKVFLAFTQKTDMDFFSNPFGCRFDGYGELFGCRLVAVFRTPVAVWLPFGCRFCLWGKVQKGGLEMCF
jgi:hypothetical protein